MQFCSKCGTILLPKKRGTKTIIKCPACNYTSKKKESLILKEEVKLAKEDKIEVIDKSVSTLPQTEEECPKCGNLKAFYWLVQTRAGDEAPTRFFKCTKCAHIWRSYT